ncbi:alkaline phosphatase family protein [Kamptonema cortianum]|uniref:Alkaline phosphatase family protein n=1 Tax=Geitlerinema calcuttense NRMC-F 0142 TaxID=2922238 RepID=A0ABT7M199_9CYAN|nr:alkaline phosphatase family protein [Geitlerinema calcuttense]MDK3159295.1 alkaline phosphatase family protein [Kamptonema cortianum]MDL5056821.1 alkaline phosphatase family protein [Geitlerinema calcuttense NRMC-F 0142]
MTRTLFIGLDGATFTVLDEMVRDQPGVGVTMPFLKHFMETGVRSPLRSTPNPLTPPAWVSIMTGRTPGNHGVFDFIRAEEQGEEVYFTLYDARDIQTETVWSMASRQNRTVVALNFPITAPPRPIAGSLVPGFVPWKHLRRNVTPPELFNRLKNIPQFDPKELAWDFEREKQALEFMSEDETEEWVRYHLPREEQWFRIAQTLLQEDRPDLMAVMFDGVDKIQHQAWRFLDPKLLSENPSAWERRMCNLCLEYFRQLDGYIRALVTLAGPDVQVFMASDHGFTQTIEVVRINTFLHEKGYLTWKASERSEAAKRREASNFADVDWEKTLAYCRTPSSNGITIRVAHQPGEPGIAPDEYDRFRDRLIQDLESLRDEATGERIIQQILKREDCFPGTCMKDAPDLTLVLRDYGFVSIRNLQPVVVPREVPAGTHHPDGIFLANGPGIQRGLQVERRNIVDVAATWLYSLGLPIPEDLEGQVPESFFTPEYLQAHPIRRGPPTQGASDRPDAIPEMCDRDKELILAQLQMLGYME